MGFGSEGIFENSPAFQGVVPKSHVVGRAVLCPQRTANWRVEIIGNGALIPRCVISAFFFDWTFSRK
jgi:hypothetical protein